MKTTAERLNEIMELRGLKQVDILRSAEPYCLQYMVKLSKSDLSQFVSGKVIPGQYKLKILALALNVNEAWLMGYEDVPMEHSPLSSVEMSTFDPSTLIKIRKKHGFTKEYVSQRAGIPYSTYVSIEQGTFTPDIYQIQALAHVLCTTPTNLLNYFGQADWVYGLDTKPKSKDDIINIVSQALNMLDPSEREEVLSAYRAKSDAE